MTRGIRIPVRISMFALAAALSAAVAPEETQAQQLSFESWRAHMGSVWVYNGFLSEGTGTPVQGSDVSPINLMPGASAVFRISDWAAISAGMNLYLQEYISLNDYDKVVPTQIETGSNTGDIAQTLSLLVSVPYLLRPPLSFIEPWRVSIGVSPSFVFRIPVSAVENSDAGAIGTYFISQGRFFYPELQLLASAPVSSRISAGGAIRWFIPFYNQWDTGENPHPLDETMVALQMVVTVLPPGRDEGGTNRSDGTESANDATDDGATDDDTTAQ